MSLPHQAAQSRWCWAYAVNDPVTEFIAARPGMAAGMLAEHIDDGSGHCAGCKWQQHAQPIWPCLIRYYALRADEVERRRAAPKALHLTTANTANWPRA